MKKIKKRMKRVVAASIAFIIAMAVNHIYALDNNIQLIMFLLVYLLTGWDVLTSAVKNIRNGRMFDETFLMGLATVCAFIVGEYPEGVAVMLFYQIGELFQSYAVYSSRKSISSLMDIRPDYANIEKNGELVKVAPEEVAVGDVIVVKPGEKVPLDGVIVAGNTTLDTKALTGESLPRDTKEGDDILSGCINITGNIKVRVSKVFGESTVAKILDLVENQGNKKAKKENFITKFARYYTPTVVVLAALVAIVPSAITGFTQFYEYLYRAMIFLVVSCPCALVISIPLSFFGGLGGASRSGILVKGSNYLELLSKMDTVVFDKTGTLTKGTFEVTEVHPAGMTEDMLLTLAAGAEKYSNHPIALSLKNAYTNKTGKSIDDITVEDVKEIPGFGIEVRYNNSIILAGNAKLLDSKNVEYIKQDSIGTIVYIAKDGLYAGCICIADMVKDDTKQAIASLKKNGVKKIVMLTGDNNRIAQKVANDIGIDEVYAELLPQDKVEKFESIITGANGNTAFVGDGVNDAPVLARADVGIAMGGMGSDAAIEAADVVIMTDEPSKISKAIAISRKTLRIAKENIVFALGVKVIVLALGALGFATMWMAVFADVGVSFIAILNSMRAMKTKNL